MRLAFVPVLALVMLACSGGRAEVSVTAAQPAPAAQPERAAQTAATGAARDEAFAAPDASGWGRAAGLKYLERTLGGGDPTSPMPMLILIHGLGDRPSRDWFTGADAIDTPLRLIMPQAPTPKYEGFAWFPFRVGDNEPDALARGIATAADRLARAITSLQAERPTLGQPIVAGFSQGGMLSYALALRHPQLVALSHPISGMLPEPLWPEGKPAHESFPRIAAMHGDADAIVPIDAARRLTAHLRKLGHDAELREFAGVAHTIDAAMTAHSVALLNAAARDLGRR
jgi:phospholipase/carboxylesterase